ncbi:uracil-DNA glycosylase [Ruegeria sediminis]|uniref:Type-4 uracil-DNA glycosylase n=1 Tax=Ruegeria sediminis TaxID=2583820 RepID=A0ABY2X4G3_9RHOB|nr:uracil-DNA glycosylase [Ruegeria sediminis]TMV10282.1 uracil-DNA glycosylase [Ruegeria sediminis]
MESALDHYTARALLEWQIELGATDAIGDAPVDRYALPDTAPKAQQPQGAQTAPAKPKDVDPVEVARKAARAAGSLPELRAAMESFQHCELKLGARQLVFADGTPGARVMIIGEAPGRDEDREGRPFVGRAGQLLDRMLEAIDLRRSENVYITNVLPWRPPQNRDPRPEEIGMMKPFLERHVDLAKPEVLVLMGNISCQAVLGKRGITRLHGQWDQSMNLPVIPMFHPAYLLRQPQMKRQAWADLLELRARLGETQ